jgi:hypothetical protein
MSDEDYMEIFPPVQATEVYKREQLTQFPLETRADSSMLFILATAVVFATLFIIAAVVFSVVSK